MGITDKTGHKLPSFEFNMFEEYRWVGHTTDELFVNKRVVIFAIPGAFTPTCSSLHLPRYNELYETFRSYGIDEVYCLAVNDSFVLNAWKKAERATNIVMLPDPDGEFTKKLGFLVNKSEVCLGDRSWRYSMIVNRGVIEKMFIEPENQGSDPFGESSADQLLKYLNPEAELPPAVTVFSKPSCPICAGVRNSLKSHHLQFEELELHEDFTIKTAKAIAGEGDLPIVFINGTKFGSPEELDGYLSTLYPEHKSLKHFDPDERLLGT